MKLEMENVVATLSEMVSDAISRVATAIEAALVAQPWPVWLVHAGKDGQWSDPMPVIGTTWEYGAYRLQVLNYEGHVGLLPPKTEFIRAFPTYEQACAFVRDERKAQA